jgi:hypothetical protein
VPRLVFALLATLVLLGARPGVAEHEVYYRYVVLGYVQDDHGAPLPARAVELVRDRTGLAYRDATDARGFFVLIARLGDESAGESLTLKIGDRQTRIAARFDPNNHVDDRGTQMDLVGGRFVERAASFHATLARFVKGPDAEREKR